MRKIPNVHHSSLDVRKETKTNLLRLQRLMMILQDRKVLLSETVDFAIAAAERELAAKRAEALSVGLSSHPA